MGWALVGCTRSPNSGGNTPSLGPVTVQQVGGEGTGPEIFDGEGIPAPTVTGPGPLHDDGDWQSSGGTGVGCFKNRASAEAFDLAMKNHEPLGDDLIGKLDSLVTLEYWEKDQLSKSFKPFTDTTYEKILEHLKRRMRIHAALFAYKMEEVDARMAVDSWKPEYKLEPTNDANPLRAPTDRGTPYCRLIQLAVRYTKPAKLEEVPKVHVSFDSRLFALLDEVNKALLVTHERIYLIGVQAEHKDSQYTRLVTLNILNENLWDLENEKSNIQAQRTQTLINQAFGDYVHVIFESTPPPENPVEYSSWSRYKSLRSAIEKMRVESDKCNHTTAESEDKQAMCTLAALKSKELNDGATGEEAFLIIYRWMFSAFGHPIPDSEIVLIDWKEREYQDAATSAMALACHYMEHEEPQESVFPTLIVKAQSYCEGYLKAVTHPEPKETDQN